jgi:hypothetical protein
VTSHLTEEQLRAIADQPNEPLRLIDPASKQVYVLLNEAVYEKMRELLQGFQPTEAYAAIDQAFAAGWSDPRMEDYDRYEELTR